MTARTAVAIGGGLAAVGAGAAIALWGTLTPAWPVASPTIAGLWVVDAATAVPLGPPETRAGIASASCAVIAAAGIAATLTRRGHAAIVAAAATLAIGLVSYGNHLAGAHLPASLAAALTVAATSVAFGAVRRAPGRVASATVLLCAAATLEPLVVVVLPLIVARAAGATALARGVAGVVGVVIAAWGLDALGATPDAPLRLAMLAQPWVWPAALAMLCGALAPLWGGRRATTAVSGTAAAIAALAAGYDPSALAVFPTVLLADGLGGLPTVGPRTRAVVAGTVMLVSLAEMSLWTTPDTWRLLAWRDAVERAVPAGTRLVTGNQAAVALSGPLFRGRPSRLAIVLDRRTAVSVGPARYGIGDPGAVARARGVTAIRLAYADVSDFVSRLPRGTVVGLVAAGGDDAARLVTDAALRRIGHVPAAGARAIAAAGIVAHDPVDGLMRGDGELHVLLGDPLSADGRRSPTDFAMRTTPEGVRLFLRGRLVATGWRSGAIAVRRGGPLVDVITDSVEGVPWPLRLAGLDVWREAP